MNWLDFGMGFIAALLTIRVIIGLVQVKRKLRWTAFGWMPMPWQYRSWPIRARFWSDDRIARMDRNLRLLPIGAVENPWRAKLRTVVQKEMKRRDIERLPIR